MGNKQGKMGRERESGLPHLGESGFPHLRGSYPQELPNVSRASCFQSRKHGSLSVSNKANSR